MIWQIGQQTEEGLQLMAANGIRVDEVIDSVSKFLLNYPRGSADQIRFSDKRKLPTHIYEVPFFIDQKRGYMEVNLSVPKYLFGNNVLEVVTPPGHKGFSVNNLSPYDHVDFWYQLIWNVINDVVKLIAKQNFVGLMSVDDTSTKGIDWNDLEIFRFDFAICQLFQDKHMVKKYIRAQAGVDKKFQRRTASGRQILYQDETIYFPSERFTAKIYRKGAEFERIQSKKIIEANKKLSARAVKDGKEPRLLSSNIQYSAEEIQRLQSYSDKILRYEFEFRPGMMSYLYNRKMNKYWSRRFAAFKKIFDYIERDTLENSKFFNNHIVVFCDMQGNVTSRDLAVDRKYFVKENVELHFEGSGKWKVVTREFNDREYKYMKILREHGIFKKEDLKKWKLFMNRELNDSRKFFRKIDGIRNTMKEIITDETGEVLYKNNAMSETPGRCRFSKSLIILMLQELHKFFDNFQIGVRPQRNEFQDKIEKYNLDLADKMLLADKAEQAVLQKKVIHIRTVRLLLEFNDLFIKHTPKQVRDRYQKTQYFRLVKLYKMLTGNKFQVANTDFGEVNRNFLTIYKGLYSELDNSYMLKFFNNAFEKHYAR
jgi:hypothetical protein